MSEDSRIVTVEIDAKVYEKIKEYSRYTKQSEQHVVNRLFKRTLRDFERGYVNLKQGYVDMGKINLEISNAFTASENEALNSFNYEAVSHLKHIED